MAGDGDADPAGVRVLDRVRDELGDDQPCIVDQGIEAPGAQAEGDVSSGAGRGGVAGRVAVAVALGAGGGCFHVFRQGAGPRASLPARG